MTPTKTFTPTELSDFTCDAIVTALTTLAREIRQRGRDAVRDSGATDPSVLLHFIQAWDAAAILVERQAQKTYNSKAEIARLINESLGE